MELLALHGWAQRMRRGDRAAVLAEVHHVLERWIDAGLAFERAAGGERCFDPAEVMNTIKWASLHRGDPVWKDHFVETGRELVREFHPVCDADGVPPAPTALPARRFMVTLERAFNVRGHPAGKPLHLRLPLPLESDALRHLQIARARSSVADTDLAVGPGRIDARLSAPIDGVVTLAAELSFEASPTVPMSGAALAPDEVQLYTRAQEGVIQVDARIGALGAELAGSAGEPWSAVKRFWDFVLDRMTCGVVHTDELVAKPLHGILDSGWYDCRLGSALLIALCRARGLPARMASGYMLYSTSPFHHYWMEVWIDRRGWVPLDLSCADLSAAERNTPWHDYFFGCLDYRMQTQRLPRLFDRSPAVRFPPSWYALDRSLEDGVEFGIFETGSGSLVYRDRISVR